MIVFFIYLGIISYLICAWAYVQIKYKKCYNSVKSEVHSYIVNQSKCNKEYLTKNFLFLFIIFLFLFWLDYELILPVINNNFKIYLNTFLLAMCFIFLYYQQRILMNICKCGKDLQ